MKEQNFQISALSLQGIRPTNRYAQKRELFIRIWDTASNSLILGVVKGSGPKGAQVATFLKREIGLAVPADPYFRSDPMRALHAVATELRAKLADDESGKREGLALQFSGAMITLVVLRQPTTAYIMHLGCGRAVVFQRKERRDCQIKPLTEDHRCSVARESRYIREKGGRVLQVRYDDGTFGHPRLFLPYVDVPGLRMSRAFGFSIVHNFLGEAEIGQYSWNEADSKHLAFVIGTDGFFDVINNEDLSKILDELLENNVDSSTLATELAYEAQKRWLQSPEKRSDDITVVVALRSSVF